MIAIKTSKEEMLFISTIISNLKSEGEVKIAGLGQFKVVKTKERQGHNPKTGEAMTIPARNKIKFAVARSLKKLVN